LIALFLFEVFMAGGIRLIVGLGNPGEEYRDTRHNAGWWLLDELAEKSGGLRLEKKFFGYVAKVAVGSREVWLLKPVTFMNKSGQAVTAIANYYKILPEQILVMHDELDLEPGQVKFKLGGGHAGHNGLRDIMVGLGVKMFWRLRMGIARPMRKGPVANYVLGRMPASERELMALKFPKIVEILPDLLCGEFSRAMNCLHSKQ